MLADLHTHSTASDGKLSPRELLAEARHAGVTLLSITDHDTVAAYESLREADTTNIAVIPGIEFSARWRKLGIHIVGLNIDPYSSSIEEGVRCQREKRRLRAEKIAVRLEKHGFRDTLAGAMQLAGDAVIGRPHFARFLRESGQVRDEKTAFRKYLGQGKIGDVREDWPEPGVVIDWIIRSEGIPVLAHPAKYKLTNLRLEELVRDFQAAGGMAMEVVTGQQDVRLTRRLASLAGRHALAASCGSDFHRPGENWARVGGQTAMPADCRPVWELWQEAAPNRQPDS
jgi:predicted metal-dependent phosphoesterase TrpH